MMRKTLTYLAIMAGVALFSALFIVIFGNSIEITCGRVDEQAPNCRITRVLLGRVTLSKHEVLGVTDVWLDESCDDGCAYRAILITASGEAVPLNEVYTDQGPVLRQMDAVRAFISGTGASFEYTEPVQWWVVMLVVGLDVMAMGIIAANYLREVVHG